MNSAEGQYLREGDFSGHTENVTCPTCDPKPEPRLIFRRKNGVGIWQCPGCEIMYASPRFNEESLLAIYENPAFINTNDYARFENWSYEDWQDSGDSSYVTSRLKVKLVSRYLDRNSRMLDVGCAMGLFCYEAGRQGFHVEGLEPSRMLSDIGRDLLGVPIHNTALENFDPGTRYNGIILWDVLEHVYDPAAILEKCFELTEPGGYIFLQVPNFAGISDRVKTFLCQHKLKKCDFKHFGFPWHVYSFNRKSLAGLLDGTGFEPVLFESWSHVEREGKTGLLAGGFSSIVKKRCLSGYITCVAKKVENSYSSEFRLG